MAPTSTIISRHDRQNAPRDLARDLARAIEHGETRLQWTASGQWQAGVDEAKLELEGPDGLTARITVHVAGLRAGADLVPADS